MPTLTFSRFENRILTIIPCPTQRVLNCSSRCSPPLELRSRSIASRLARSRVRRRTRPIVARLAFWFWWWFDRFDFLLLLFFRCVCWCVVVVEKQALFVSFGMKKKKKKRRTKKKMMRNRQKEREAKIFSELMNQLHHSHMWTSHLQTRRTFNLLFEKLKYLFFARFLFANIPIVRRPVSNATSCDVRVNTLERKSTVQSCEQKICLCQKWEKSDTESCFSRVQQNNKQKNTKKEKKANKQTKNKKREESKQTNKKQKIAKKTDGETTPLDKKH